MVDSTFQGDQSKILKMGPGSLIAARYEVIERIGAGGMGIVLKCYDHALNDQVVALKLLNPILSQNETVLKRFMNEVLVARALSHPNIVRIHDIGNAPEGFAYISMEFVDGPSLLDIITPEQDDSSGQGVALPFDDALQYLFQIISGVAYAHEKGVIHRDLKPANVLIAKSGEAKIVDFGTARMLGESTGLTQDGQQLGTPDYMSPEQICGQQVDTRSDIYALGVIAFQLTTGRRPFMADSPVAVAFKHVNDPFPFFANEEQGIPRWFEAVVHKAAAKKKEDRFDTAEDFAFAIAEQVPNLRTYGALPRTRLPTFTDLEAQALLAGTGRFTLGETKQGTWEFEIPKIATGPGGSGTYQLVQAKPRLLSLSNVAIVSAVAILAGFGLFVATKGLSGKEIPQPVPVVSPVAVPSIQLVSREEERINLTEQLLVSALPSVEPTQLMEPEKTQSAQRGGPAEHGRDTSSSIAPESTSAVSPTTHVQAVEQKQSTTEIVAEPTKRIPTTKINEPVVETTPMPRVTQQKEEVASLSGELQDRFKQKIAPDGLPNVINMPPPKSAKSSERDMLKGQAVIYSGEFVVDGVARTLSMDLVIQGDKIMGLATVQGYDTFEVTGMNSLKGVSLTLKSRGATFILDGSKRKNMLRGTFRNAMTNKLGQWHATN